MSDETDDLDAKIIARAAHLLAPPPPTPEQRLAAVEADLSRERVRSEAAEAEVSRLGSTAFAYRMRAYSAEARVRELETERERHEERRRLVQVRLTPDELDAVDDAVERDGGPSRGEVIRQCVRQVLLPERAAAEGRLSGALAAAEFAPKNVTDSVTCNRKRKL